MQILIAFVVMAMIGMFTVVLVASAALIQCLPLLIVVLAVVGSLRWWKRRSHPRNPPWPPTLAARPRAIPPPAPPPRAPAAAPRRLGAGPGVAESGCATTTTSGH
jgi:hypothetical protein